MSKEELFELGLLAIADTAKKAFIEGFLTAANPDYCVDLNDPEPSWLASNACAAITKAVEEYAGGKHE